MSPPPLSQRSKYQGTSTSGRIVRTAIRRSTLLTLVVKSRPVQVLVQTMRGLRLVEEAVGFLLHQCIGSTPRSFTIRATGQRVHLRPRSADVVGLNEIFGRRIYELPGAALGSSGELQDAIIVDLGANIGLFVLWAAHRFPGSTLIAFEPDRENAALLARNVQVNGLTDRVQLSEAAVGARAGRVRFAAGDYMNSRVVPDCAAGSTEVQLVDALPLMAQADFVKMDIEGSEWDILADPRLAGSTARVLSMEWHRVPDGPEDPEATATSSLVAAGYAVHVDPPDLPIAGTLWAVR